MKKASVLVLALMLAGCASDPKPHGYTKSAKIVQPAQTVQPTPNQIVKKRWFRGFKIKLFHR